MQCTFCGREVKPTVHRRDGRLYEVDYYILLTGRLERTVMQDMFKESAQIEFHKLLDPRWVVTCADCIAREDTERELEQMFSGVPDPPPEGVPASS